MAHRHLPVRPNLEQLKHQAKDLLGALRRGDSDALEDFRVYSTVSPETAKLVDAQHVLARSYEAPGWARLVLACRLIDAIWRDDLEEVQRMVTRHPALIREEALMRKSSNWGPPMSYAANLGRERIVAMLDGMGATDHAKALQRAALQTQIGTARMLHGMMKRPMMTADALDGPAYTLSAEGTALMLELGAKVVDDDGRRLAPVHVVLETDSRKPAEMHRILELYVEYGLVLPDTPVMAVYRGRIDLLEGHLRRDPGMLGRRFRFEEMYPPELGCHDEVMATHGTPLGGATLLHLAIDYDEIEVARWLLDRGMNVNLRATVDGEGFGGHTALFATVMSQPNIWANRRGDTSARFTEMLLERGAEVNVRASLRKQMGPGYGEDRLREYREVTARSWGERFHRREFVNETAVRLIREAGGVA